MLGLNEKPALTGQSLPIRTRCREKRMESHPHDSALRCSGNQELDEAVATGPTLIVTRAANKLHKEF